MSNRRVPPSYSLVCIAVAALALYSGCGRATDLPEIPEIRSGFEVLMVCPSGSESVIPAEFTGATATYAAGLSGEVSRFVRAGDHPSLWCGDGQEGYRAYTSAYRPAIMATLTYRRRLEDFRDNACRSTADPGHSRPGPWQPPPTRTRRDQGPPRTSPVMILRKSGRPGGVSY